MLRNGARAKFTSRHLPDQRSTRWSWSLLQLTHFFGPTIIKRSFTSLDQVPSHFIQAVIATEDHRFYDHDGVDKLAIVRAAIRNFVNGRIVQGGSTITQQMVRNFYLGQQRTFRRKTQEALLAILVERKLTKDHILQMYLNQVYYGQDGPAEIRGVGEASRYYFGKDVSELDYPEAALLAGLIQSPNRYDPFRYPGRALVRRNAVLNVMKTNGVITPHQYSKYVQARLMVQPQPEKHRAKSAVLLASRLQGTLPLLLQGGPRAGRTEHCHNIGRGIAGCGGKNIARGIEETGCFDEETNRQNA